MDSHEDITSAVDAYTSSVVAQFYIDDLCPTDPLQQFEEECLHSFSTAFTDTDNFDVDNGILVEDSAQSNIKEQRPHSMNAFKYSFGNVFQSNWYAEFLQPSVRERT
jgi:hypothetical protein